MSDAEEPWAVTISVRTRDPRVAGWLERALGPEVTREVPRARATLARPAPDRLDIVLAARDTGAVRAALNTYLGWVHLALATLPPAGRPPG
jgi:tRNA threonylcarbamoyladenosine modification (KEOPS) complex  Pcc1 subunit